jgi:hypothetical protein
MYNKILENVNKIIHEDECGCNQIIENKNNNTCILKLKLNNGTWHKYPISFKNLEEAIQEKNSIEYLRYRIHMKSYGI